MTENLIKIITLGTNDIHRMGDSKITFWNVKNSYQHIPYQSINSSNDDQNKSIGIIQTMKVSINKILKYIPY